MCMFQFPNRVSNAARFKGMEYFECGGCPECLQKKSRKWALRCSMEAKVSPGVMVTLTYDTYKEGSTIEENPVDTSIKVNKKQCQNFLKRLRKHFAGKSVKYLLTAEYGKRTHRAHYHALLFGVTFDDLIFYKSSKRGNRIYKSKTLEKIWSHGICTVDAINLSAKIARYCTKYCAKDAGVDDTFMLFSRGIGDAELLRLFNGKSYWVDGREYSIPREIWQKYIEKKYRLPGYSRYVGVEHLEACEKKLHNVCFKTEKLEKYVLDKLDAWRVKFNTARRLKQRKNINYCRRMQYKYRRMLYKFRMSSEKRLKNIVDNFENSSSRVYAQTEKRDIFFVVRDADALYRAYLVYWKAKNDAANFNRPSDIERISQLSDNKYWSYKQKAIQAKLKQRRKRFFVPPRSNCHGFDPFAPKKEYEEKSFAPLSRHYRANDTRQSRFYEIFQRMRHLRRQLMRANAKRLEVNPFEI